MDIDYIKDIEKYAKQAVQKPEDFGYWGSDDMFDTWGFCGVDRHSMSDLIERSNFTTISEELMKKFPDDFRIEPFNHWAVGELDRLVCRVYIVVDGVYKISESFYAAMEVKNDLDGYSIYDENHYCDLQYEESMNTIKGYWGIEKLVYQDNLNLEPWYVRIYEELVFNLNVDCVHEELSENQLMQAIYNLELCSEESSEVWDKWCDETNQKRYDFSPNRLSRNNPDQLELELE